MHSSGRKSGRVLAGSAPDLMVRARTVAQVLAPGPHARTVNSAAPHALVGGSNAAARVPAGAATCGGTRYLGERTRDIAAGSASRTVQVHPNEEMVAV